MTEEPVTGQAQVQQSIKRDVEDIHDFLAVSELAGVRFMEISARRLAEDRKPDVATTFEVQVQHRLSAQQFEPRFRVTVKAPQADYLIDLNLSFSLTEPVEPSAPLVVEFVERVAVMAAYPFIREALATAASRLAVEVPILGLLRAGQFKLESHQPATAADEPVKPGPPLHESSK